MEFLYKPLLRNRTLKLQTETDEDDVNKEISPVTIIHGNIILFLVIRKSRRLSIHNINIPSEGATLVIVRVPSSTTEKKIFKTFH